MLDLHRAMVDLSKSRPLFHAEADFQHALAWHLRETGAVDDVRLEKPLSRDDRRIRVDMFVRADGAWHAVELKYWTRLLDHLHDGDDYILANQAAQDLSRYDFWRDVARMEKVVESGEAATAWVVALSKDRTYWSLSMRPTVDHEMRLHEGRAVSGSIGWSEKASEGTTKSRKARHELRGQHSLAWQRYSNVSECLSGEFKYLALEIGT